MRINLINTSGGKDSTATLLVAIERGVEFEAVFADTGNEHALTYEYLEYLEQRLGLHIRRVRAEFTAQIAAKRRFIAADRRMGRDNKTGRKVRWSNKAKRRALEGLEPTGVPFLDLCLWRGRFPSRRAQFCTDELKKLPMFEQVQLPYVQAGHEVWSWQGIRRDESPNRANALEFEPDRVEGLFSYRPIVTWSVEDVFAMLRRHGVEPNPLYRLGMTRVGCMPCINANKGEVFEISRRFPEHVEKVREWEHLVGLASKRACSTFFHRKTTRSVVDQKIDRVVAWSRTRHGGKQMDLLKALEVVPPVCSSSYGLCE